MQETLTGSGKRWESSRRSTSGATWQRSLPICFGVPARSPVPAHFIFPGSVSRSIRFRFLADPGCCQGGYRWERFFRLSLSWQPGSARGGTQRAQGSVYVFCSDIAVRLIIILWWVSPGRKGWSMGWRDVMCWKRGVSGQTGCGCLTVGSWENGRRGIISEQFGLPKKTSWCKSREALGFLDAQQSCWGLWMQQESHT